ncbi:hypothetical protein ABVK25_007196 [Lepraria finkii]|uniref:Uncharacterized protein n=1 Tax=Lepraria finkii TaxID=1340010 RepID=A0ABR4B703_9LECA
MQEQQPQPAMTDSNDPNNAALMDARRRGEQDRVASCWKASYKDQTVRHCGGGLRVEIRG